MSISANQQSSFLEVRDLHGGYGKIPILNGINFAVSAGEFVGILGHNGMGKTTLLRTLIGHLKSSAGWFHLAAKTSPNGSRNGVHNPASDTFHKAAKSFQP